MRYVHTCSDLLALNLACNCLVLLLQLILDRALDERNIRPAYCRNERRPLHMSIERASYHTTRAYPEEQVGWLGLAAVCLECADLVGIGLRESAATESGRALLTSANFSLSSPSSFLMRRKGTRMATHGPHHSLNTSITAGRG